MSLIYITDYYMCDIRYYSFMNMLAFYFREHLDESIMCYILTHRLDDDSRYTRALLGATAWSVMSANSRAMVPFKRNLWVSDIKHLLFHMKHKITEIGMLPLSI